jgi:uncharacterized protein (DUF362 family)
VGGRTVLIKPNLVRRATAESGIVTDPQVVLAIVDSALAAGAEGIKIIEGRPGGSNFSDCGYDFLQDYGGTGRVSLVDLDPLPVVPVAIDGGLAYQQIYMPELILQPDTLLVSVGKLKVHGETMATLATKNVFGLPSQSHYEPPDEIGRYGMHYRGVNQAVVDINLARPIDFAVVDGVWGMEDYGPWAGTPVRMDMVVAGANPVAVDRVCMDIIGVPQDSVQHLTYAARFGLGPENLNAVQVSGDSVTPRAFGLPTIPPLVEYPRMDPPVFTPERGELTTATYWISRRCVTQIEVVRTSETSVEVTRMRLLRDWALTRPGTHTVEWDGRDDQGDLVPPGTYRLRIEADGAQLARNAFASSWVEVLAEPPTRRTFLPVILE